jgi:RNA polymerase sigma factor (TIGR02999 family)
MSDYTRWLNSSHSSRSEEVFAGLYAELRRIAQGRIASEGPGRTLNATGLVHEAWLRLEKSPSTQWRDRKHFYGIAAEVMRRILVEAARRRLAAKRGGGEEIVPLDEALPVFTPVADERLLGIHEVIDQLAEEDEMKAQIVKLRFFGGLKHDEIATLLEVSEPTIRRHWALAKMWLYDALNDAE